MYVVKYFKIEGGKHPKQHPYSGTYIYELNSIGEFIYFFIKIIFVLAKYCYNKISKEKFIREDVTKAYRTSVNTNLKPPVLTHRPKYVKSV